MADPIKVLLVEHDPVWVTKIRSIRGPAMSEAETIEYLRLVDALGGSPEENPDPEIEFVGVASTAAEAIRLAAELQPGIIIVDLDIPGIDGIDLIRRVVQIAYRSAVIPIAAHVSDDLEGRLCEVGAESILARNELERRLFEIIKSTSNKRTFLDMVPLIEPQPSSDGQTLAHLTLAIQDWTGSAREEPIEVTHIGQVIVLMGAWRDRYLLQVLQVEPGKASLFVNGLGLKQGTERDHRGSI